LSYYELCICIDKENHSLSFHGLKQAGAQGAVVQVVPLVTVTGQLGWLGDVHLIVKVNTTGNMIENMKECV